MGGSGFHIYKCDAENDSVKVPAEFIDTPSGGKILSNAHLTRAISLSGTMKQL